MTTTIPQASDAICAYYRDRLTRYGDTVEAVGWNAENQVTRFKLLTHGWPLVDASVLDVGCGRGDLCLFLRAQGWEGDYCGLDVVPEFVEIASRRTGTRCVLLDGRSDLLPVCDYAFASGVFNLDLDNYQFAVAWSMQTILTNMWAFCRRGMAFDCLDAARADRVAGQWYVDPRVMRSWVTQFLPYSKISRFDTESVRGNLIVQVNKEVDDAGR